MKLVRDFFAVRRFSNSCAASCGDMEEIRIAEFVGLGLDAATVRYCGEIRQRLAQKDLDGLLLSAVHVELPKCLFL